MHWLATHRRRGGLCVDHRVLLLVQHLLSVLFLLQLDELILDHLLSLLLNAHNVADVLVHLLSVLGVEFLRDEALPVEDLEEPGFTHVCGGQVDAADGADVLVAVVDVVKEFRADQNGGEDDPKHA